MACMSFGGRRDRRFRSWSLRGQRKRADSKGLTQSIQSQGGASQSRHEGPVKLLLAPSLSASHKSRASASVSRLLSRRTKARAQLKAVRALGTRMKREDVWTSSTRRIEQLRTQVRPEAEQIETKREGLRSESPSWLRLLTYPPSSFASRDGHRLGPILGLLLHALHRWCMVVFH
jgi:hypothetical protein